MGWLPEWVTKGGVTWGKVLKAYLIFALVHTAVKVHKWVRIFKRSEPLLRKAFKGYKMDVAGTELLENKDRFHDWRLDTMKPFLGKEDMVLTPGPGYELACLSEEAVEFILKTEFKKITKPGHQSDYLMFMLGEFIGAQGIFCLRHGQQPEVQAEDKAWWLQRKTASKIFTKNRFSTFMTKVFTEKADTMIEMMGKVADREGRLDAQKAFFAFTMDSVQKIFFNRDVDTVSGDVDRFAKSFDQAHDSMIRFTFDNMGLIIASCEVLPWPFGTIFGKQETNIAVNLFRLFNSEARKFRTSVDYLRAKTLKIIREAKADPHLGKRDDLLALFLNSSAGKDLTDEQLQAIILNFIIAGRDTTACTLTWMMFELTQHPEVQDKLIAEVDAKLSGRNPTLEDLDPSNMPYLTGVLFETLRLHPPVPEDLKEATEDVVFKGKLIPKATRFVFFPYTYGRDPNRFPDPESFQPERWIPFTTPSEYLMATFQGGNRFCLGKDLAVLEAKLLMAKLMQRFSFRLQDGEAEKISYSIMITMSLANSADKTSTNLWILPTRRQTASA